MLIKKMQTKKTLTFQVAAKDISLATESLETLITENRLPNPAKKFRISRLVYGEDTIKNIDISFDDRSSKYELSGTDLLILESIKTRIEAFAGEHRTWFGGGLMVMGIFALMVTTAVIMIKLPPGTTLSPVMDLSISLGGMALFVLAFYLLFSDRLSDWFPTTAIYIGSASAMERYTAEFTFWGFVIGFFGLLVTLVLAIKPKRNGS